MSRLHNVTQENFPVAFKLYTYYYLISQASINAGFIFKALLTTESKEKLLLMNLKNSLGLFRKGYQSKVERIELYLFQNLYNCTKSAFMHEFLNS